MINVKATLMIGTDALLDFLLTVVPNEIKVSCNLPYRQTLKIEERLMTRSQQYLTQSLVTKEELEELGEGRPEEYVYLYAAIRQFRLPGDDIWVRYVNEDAISLGPADFSYQRTHAS